MYNNSIIQQVLDFAKLRIEYDDPTSAHLAPLVASHAMTTLQMARFRDELRQKPLSKRRKSERDVLGRLARAADKFSKTIHDITATGVKNKVNEINLSHYFVSLFGSDSYGIVEASKDTEEIVGRIKAAAEAVQA